jgi:hypothetical protein
VSAEALRPKQGGIVRKLVFFLLAPGMVLAIPDSVALSVNHWHVSIRNDGKWGGAYPVGDVRIFGAGLWVGALEGADTLVSAAFYDQTEFVPTLCRYWREGYTDPRDRVYQYPGDWPPPQSRFPMAPQVRHADQDLWCCFCDSDPSRHHSPGVPLGIDVGLSVYAFGDSASSDFFFLKYELFNFNDYALNDVCFGVVVDPDIGEGVDDLLGFIRDELFYVPDDTVRVRNTGFVYDDANYEPPWPGVVPRIIAVSYLNPPGDSTDLCAFKGEAYLPNDVDRYLTMRGYDYQTREYVPFDTLGDQTPGDKWFVESAGPVELSAQSSRTFWFAVIGAPFGDSGEPAPMRDTSDLVIAYRAARDRFQQLLGIEEREPARTGAFSVQPTVFGSFLPLCITLKGDREAKVTAYDMNGRVVRRLAGRGRIIWNGSGADGRMLPAGVYFLRASGSETTTFKVVLSR